MTPSRSTSATRPGDPSRNDPPPTATYTLRRRRAAVGRALVAALVGRDDEVRTLLARDPSAARPLIASGEHHRITGYLWRAVSSAPVPDGDLDTLQRTFYGAVASHLRTVAELPTIEQAFARAGVDWVILKGPVLVAAHGDPGLRHYGDLDVLVRPSHLGRALQALEEAGAQTIDQNWALLHQELRGELHLRLPHGTVVDLHWHLINQPWERRSFRLDIDELLDRRTSVETEGRHLPTLDPTDTLIHLALHTMKSGADRLLWFKDIERTIHQRPPDPRELAARCHRWGTGLAVAAAVQQAERALGQRLSLTVPPAASRAWLALLRVTSAISPPEATSGSGSPARAAARATAASLGSSVAALTRKGVLAARPAGHGRRRVDPASPASMHYQSGGAPARASFLADVAAHGRTPNGG